MRTRLLAFSAIALAGVAVAQQKPAAGPLRVLKSNPRWFADPSGKAVLLTGSHVWQNLQDNGLLIRGAVSNPPQLVITDIDNRALRLLDLTTHATTSVMYNRDQIVNALPRDQRQSSASCAELNWPISLTTGAPTHIPVCVQPATAESPDMTLAQAAAQCQAAGARLCEPAELLSAGALREGSPKICTRLAIVPQKNGNSASRRSSCDSRQ